MTSSESQQSGRVVYATVSYNHQAKKIAECISPTVPAAQLSKLKTFKSVSRHNTQSRSDDCPEDLFYGMDSLVTKSLLGKT